MALWQFTTIAALVAVLLVYVMVLTNRIGAANALLKRIEEALVKPRPITENVRATMARAAAAGRASGAPAAVGEAAFALAPATGSEVREMESEANEVESQANEMESQANEMESQANEMESQANEMESQANEMESQANGTADAPEVPARDRRVSFLTVRDLKVIARSGRRSSDSTVGVSPLAAATFEIRDFLESANAAATEDVVPANPEVLDPAGARVPNEPSEPSEPATAAADPMTAAADNITAAADPMTAAAEAPTAAAEEQSAAQPVDEDLHERRRKRDAQLILSAQRRRRRTRGF